MKRRLMLGALAGLLLWCAAFSTAAWEEALTQAETDLTAEGELGAGCEECALGDLAADAVRAAAAADFALVPAGALTGTLYAGAVFESDLRGVLRSDDEILTCEITVRELKQLLEISVGVLVTDESERIVKETSSWDGFLQVSGFSWDYDVSAPPGERVLRLRIGGKETEPEDTRTKYLLAAPAPVLDGTLGYPEFAGKESGVTLFEAMRRYCAASAYLTEPERRSSALGTASYPLIDSIPIPVIVAACVMIALIAMIPKRKEQRHFSFQK